MLNAQTKKVVEEEKIFNANLELEKFDKMFNDTPNQILKPIRKPILSLDIVDKMDKKINQFRSHSNIKPCERAYILTANLNQINSKKAKEKMEKTKQDFRCKVVNNPLTPFKNQLDDPFSFKDYNFDPFFKELKVIKNLPEKKTNNVFENIESIENIENLDNKKSSNDKGMNHYPTESQRLNTTGTSSYININNTGNIVKNKTSMAKFSNNFSNKTFSDSKKTSSYSNMKEVIRSVEIQRDNYVDPKFSFNIINKSKKIKIVDKLDKANQVKNTKNIKNVGVQNTSHFKQLLESAKKENQLKMPNFEPFSKVMMTTGDSTTYLYTK